MWGGSLAVGCRSGAGLPAARTETASTPKPAPPPSQRLYRVEIRSEESAGSLRLVLRHWSDERFELAASDPLGRGLWTLTVSDGAASWTERSPARRCRLDPDRPLPWPRLGLTLAPRILPALLTGARSSIERTDLGRLEWHGHDRRGRLAIAGEAIEVSWRETAREPLRGAGPVLAADLESAEECPIEAVP